jgi:dipeptidase D
VNAPIDPALEGLTPRSLWEQFDALRRIPRPSLAEEGVRAHLRALARDNGFGLREDGAGNLVLVVPARGRGVGKAPLSIQGHMDMVCEKATGVEHDFTRDAIALQRREVDVDGRPMDVLQACGTTLGSDNGIGCATALAIALEPDLDHPPLELLFTANEENGMTGAAALDPNLVTARRLLNLDAEEDGTIYLSCAGGRDLVATWTVERQNPGSDAVPLEIVVDGLRGGHSGVDIHLGRANAIVLAVRALSNPGIDLDGVQLASFEGGGRANAIPRRARVVLWCARSRVDAVIAQIATAAENLRNEIAATDPDLEVSCETISPDGVLGPLPPPIGKAIFRAVASIPDGVLAWSEVIDGLVETSNNIGIFTTDETSMRVQCLSRSSKEGAVVALQERVERKLESSGASVLFQGEYPGWEAKLDTELLAVARTTYARLFGRQPALKAIHAGLECGILGRRIPNLEMIAFGPAIHNAHTPDEMLVIDTVAPFWRFVSELVADLCR